MTSKYINPFTDFGFKRLFGEEANKHLLIDFLNELLSEYLNHKIKDLTFLKNEHLADLEIDRKSIYDLYCENERGEKFIVELQRAPQLYFKDRSVLYATYPIQEQAKRGKWNYQLKAVYTIAILNFELDDEKHNTDYRHDVKLMNVKKKKVFYDKLTFIYLEMPKFKKTIDELETRFDKWLYVLRNLERLDNIPNKLREEIFESFFETAEVAKMTRKQLLAYQDSLKVYRDNFSVVETAKINKALEIAKNLKTMNLPTENIAEATGLSIQDIENI